LELGQIGAAIKERPWILAVVGGGALGLWTLARRRSAPEVVGVPVGDGGPPRAPGPAGGGGDGGLSGILDSLGSMQQQQAAFMAQSLAAQQTQFGEFLSTTRSLLSMQPATSETIAAPSTSTATVTSFSMPTGVSPKTNMVPTQTSPVQAVTKLYTAGSGYSTQVVTIASKYDQQVYDLKQQFTAAESRGDTLSMAIAKGAAAKVRNDAAAAGVTLSDWAANAATAPTTSKPKSSGGGGGNSMINMM
jgi:hypothetical protein